MKKKLQHTEMTEVEALILLNQALIMATLGVLISGTSNEMKQLLSGQAERTKGLCE